MTPDILLVPPSLYSVADKILNTKILFGTRFRNYIKTQYKNEKPKWERHINFLECGKKLSLNSIIRREYYDENCYVTKKFHLPRAMKKQGYYVKKTFAIGYGQDDYEPKICKRNK